jgi:hypothetical protein
MTTRITYREVQVAPDEPVEIDHADGETVQIIGVAYTGGGAAGWTLSVIVSGPVREEPAGSPGEAEPEGATDERRGRRRR